MTTSACTIAEEFLSFIWAYFYTQILEPRLWTKCMPTTSSSLGFPLSSYTRLQQAERFWVLLDRSFFLPISLSAETGGFSYEKQMTI